MRQAKREKEFSHNSSQWQPHLPVGRGQTLLSLAWVTCSMCLLEMKELNYTLELLGNATNILHYSSFFIKTEVL